MALKDLFARTEKRSGFLPVEKAGFIYNIATTLLILVLYDRIVHPDSMLSGRFVVLLSTFAWIYVYTKFPCRFTLFLRIAFQLGLLSYWYPDTYEFNRTFPNLDHLFAGAEQVLFHGQPAVSFYEKMGSYWVSEFFNFGYFSYYPMILTVVLFYFFKRPLLADKATFILIASFYLYYLIFIFVPVAGPQFYFPLLSPEECARGVFPAVNDYFNFHSGLQAGPSSQGGGLFSRLVELSQAAGERPTAAFPSSHVGISTIVMILSCKARKKLFFWMFPLYLLLCGATVYIQAHYLIDVLGGWATAFLFYYLTSAIYNRWFLPR